MSSLKEAVHCHKEPGHEHVGLPVTEAEICEEVCAEVEASQPDHTWVAHLVDSVTVKSHSHGRIRFHLDFPGDEILSDSLRREVGKLDSAKLASYSTRTQTALVFYDVQKANALDISMAILRGVREFARIHGECDLSHHFHERRRKAAQEKHDHDHAHEGHDHKHKDDAHAGEDCDHDHS